jgi:hypothetical protein
MTHIKTIAFGNMHVWVWPTFIVTHFQISFYPWPIFNPNNFQHLRIQIWGLKQIGFVVSNSQYAEDTKIVNVYFV